VSGKAESALSGPQDMADGSDVLIIGAGATGRRPARENADSFGEEMV
jgi:glycerol-3-phosphate dehydrogenase